MITKQNNNGMRAEHLIINQSECEPDTSYTNSR